MPETWTHSSQKKIWNIFSFSFWQQQSCQPVGLPSVKRSQFLLQRPLSQSAYAWDNVSVCCWKNQALSPTLWFTLYVNNLRGYFPCAGDGASVNFLSLQLGHLLRPLCLEHPGAQEISQKCVDEWRREKPGSGLRMPEQHGLALMLPWPLYWMLLPGWVKPWERGWVNCKASFSGWGPCKSDCN